MLYKIVSEFLVCNDFYLNGIGVWNIINLKIWVIFSNFGLLWDVYDGIMCGTNLTKLGLTFDKKYGRIWHSFTLPFGIILPSFGLTFYRKYGIILPSFGLKFDNNFKTKRTIWFIYDITNKLSYTMLMQIQTRFSKPTNFSFFHYMDKIDHNKCLTKYIDKIQLHNITIASISLLIFIELSPFELHSNFLFS